MKKPSPEQRKMLGAFLADRRGQLKPADLGLSGVPRRTPGLRREEVAVLAGVSVSWYTWLEQGRGIRASADTLRRLANVLRLSPVEAAHLFTLSSREPPSFAMGEQLSDGMVRLLHAINPVPAYIRNSRLDILAWNAAVADLFVDYSIFQSHERNTLRLLFLYQPYRTLILDWEPFTRGMLRTFRAARARAQDKAPFDELVAELRDGSPEFRSWWTEVGVDSFDEGTKRLQHPTLGRIGFNYIALTPEGRSELSLTVYVPQPSEDGIGGAAAGLADRFHRT